jgi:hypothetical protein
MHPTGSFPLALLPNLVSNMGEIDLLRESGPNVMGGTGRYRGADVGANSVPIRIDNS